MAFGGVAEIPATPTCVTKRADESKFCIRVVSPADRLKTGPVTQTSASLAVRSTPAELSLHMSGTRSLYTLAYRHDNFAQLYAGRASTTAPPWSS